MPLYRVVADTESYSRFDVGTRRGLSPLVGREDEVALLRRRWALSMAGGGQAVLLSGEGGIGKSRLVEVMREQATADGCPHRMFRCSPYHANSALYPLMDHLERRLSFQPGEEAGEKLLKLERLLSTHVLPLEQTVPLLAAFLGLDSSSRYTGLRLAPQQQRQQTFNALITWLLEEARQQPVLTVWDDLHWADPSTIELLSLLMERLPSTRMLSLLTFRPEFRPPWAMASHLAQLTLNRFGPQQVERLVTQVAGGKPLPGQILSQIVAQTDGVPLFVEELTKSVLESPLLQERSDHYELVGTVPSLSIPATLRDALMARLDRLKTGKTVAQIGATLGRTFAYSLLRAVSDLDTAVLGQALHSLVEAELLYQRGVPPHATYTFKHALIQETAYQSLLRSTRGQHHRRIADVLGEQFPEIADSQPELVAHHYAAAALEQSAIPYWLAAGMRDNARSAYTEAITHLTQGLDALRSLPETPERLQREVEFCTLLGPAVIALKGYGSPDVVRLYDQAQELCHRLGDPPQLFPILYGLTRARYNRAEHDLARGLGTRLLRVAEARPEPTLLLAAHTILGAIEVTTGQLEVAMPHLQTANALYDPSLHGDLVTRYATDNGIVSGNFTMWALWCLGYPDRALKKGNENTSLAEELAHPLTLAMTYCFRAVAHQYRREQGAVRKWAEVAMTISSKHGFLQWLGLGRLLVGWAEGVEKYPHQYLRQMVEGLAMWRSAGAEGFVPYGLGLLAEAYEQEHQEEEGLRTVDAALEQVERTDERQWEAELHRIRGNLILLTATGDAEDRAETCFHRALGVSRRQQAKSLELRAAVSLADLWRRQGKRAEAHDLLAPIRGWFTEGFDTADLQAARALLEKLNPRDTTA